MHFDQLNTFHGCTVILYSQNIGRGWIIIVALIFGLIQGSICYQLFNQIEDPLIAFSQKGFEVLLFIISGLLSFQYHQGYLDIFQRKDMADGSTQHEV